MDLPWNRFRELHGDPRRNWELLCREVIRRRFERYGPLLTRKQQPGVEFHLKIERDGGELGGPGRHWGWQCRWFDDATAFRVDGNLRADQRRSIEEAIAKTVAHVPTLTDWVLWTRDRFSGNDQRWFEELQAPFTLHKADEETLAGMLTGPAEILRQTWFGDLVLDQALLSRHWREALAPIANRYVSDLHVDVPAHDELADYLPDAELRQKLQHVQERLGDAEREVVQAVEESFDDSPGESGRAIWRTLASVRERLGPLTSVLEAGELPRASEVEAATVNPGELEAVRSAVAQGLDRRREAFAFGQADRALTAVEDLLRPLAQALQVPLLAVSGTAGAGKTHLAASLSGPEGQPRGILVLGRQFGSEIEDDDLARKAGIGADSDGLLEALEALGVREGRRVPLVIDGLNESRDPRNWRVTLARLAERLRRLPHVVGVVTLRPNYRDFALPDGTPVIEIQGFEGVEDDAVTRYFDYYKIDADTTAIEWWRPSEPLLLSIFCQTANPTRKDTAGPADLPGSLHEVFENYLDGLLRQTADRLRVEPRAVERAVLDLALSFFDEGARELGVERVAEVLEDERWSEWERTLRFQLEAEGLLQRDVVATAEALDWSYDLLGGHLIAKAILERHPDRAGVAERGTVAALTSHPLREDVVVGLSGLLAAEGAELTAIFAQAGPLSAEATLASARLAAHEVGDVAVSSMIGLFAPRPEAVLEAISPLTFRADHPLNGRLLDVLLRGMETWERDLAWTEWVRRRVETTEAQLSELTRRWKDGRLEPGEDASLAWATWLLTTTEKPLRDRTVYALYEFGRRDPRRLFSRAIEMLSVSDPSVAEGLLAASYGVAMSMQTAAAEERGALIEFAAELDRRLLGDEASQPTCHWLIREYAYRTTQLASWLSMGAFPARADAAQPPFPQPQEQLRAFSPGDEVWAAVHGAFRIDSPTYSVGRLVEGRTHHDDERSHFMQITGEIRARVADLGWTAERFLEIDREIGRFSTGGDDPAKGERYGKKYGWVGFYEAAGRLSDRRELPAPERPDSGWRLPDVRIDPSFPRTVDADPPALAEWVQLGGEDERWVRRGHVDLSDNLFRREEDGVAWLVVDGYLDRKPSTSGRRAFCAIRGLIALDGWVTAASYLAEHGLGPEAIPPNPGGYSYFAGEAPWSPTFDSHATDRMGQNEPEVRRLGRMEDGPRVELLGVDFSWEGHRSVMNDAQIGALPSKAFSRLAGLRKIADRAEFVDYEGRAAARSMAIRRSGWSGEILCIREDLVEAYSAKRGGEWGWAVWGERELLAPNPRSRPPDWLSDARRQGDNRFGRVVSLAENRRGANEAAPRPRRPGGTR